MPQVKIYSTLACPFCVKAKEWLKENNVDYDEILLEDQDAIKRFKADCPGKTTVPQILINDDLIEGGYDGMMAQENEVRKMLTE